MTPPGHSSINLGTPSQGGEPRTGRGQALTAPRPHLGHRIIERTPDMAGRPVVICVTCNMRLAA